MEAAARAAAWADLIEIRADFIQDLELNLELLFRVRPRPLIFTLRSREEGGTYAGSERKRLETILRAAQCGADYVDIEFSAAWKVILQSVPRARVVLSSHHYSEMPADLDSLADAMSASGAEVLKIAVQASSLADNLKIRKLLERARDRKQNICALAMGNEGMPARILGPLWGSWMTFASLPGGEATAEGQLPADVLVEQYRIREITGQTRLLGVVGKPLRHSLSPVIHNAALAARGEQAVLLPLETSRFDDFLEFQNAVPLIGAAVTIPYKRDAYAFAGSLSAAAEQTGAVNTLIRKNGIWHGENTDIEGFLRPLKRRVRPGMLRAVVLGAGGAARAVVYALRSEGAEVWVVARDIDKARELAADFQAHHAPWGHLESLSWDLMVNATPVGMFPDVGHSPVPATLLGGEWVYDLVYNPAETLLLQEAAQRGRKTIDGTEMFLGQACKQHNLWFGISPAEDVMGAALKKALAGDAGPRGAFPR